ncbi:two-component regulator propeller domain-containing protein [uncultured Draconibacterium sp.]|uniref:hybrid sensor histidine kinase/response regulator transcription factor n=1 Tax=uncultured Draconibacterium sp. TaxID=1573823 RepID=UPI0032167D1F
MNIRNYILFVVLFLCSWISIPLAKGESDILFYNLNEEYGMSIRETNQACSDDNGFIWISSKMGILRYSLGDIRVYQLPVVSHNIVEVRMEYSNGILYVYTNNGQIFVYNSILDKFEFLINLSADLRNPYLVVNQILIDQSGKLWIASSFGLFYYSRETGLKAQIQNQDIQTVEWKDNDRFFFIADGYVKLFRISELQEHTFFKFPEEENYIVSTLSYDHSTDNLWIGTNANGQFILKSGQQNFQFVNIEEIPHQPILAIEAISDSKVLLGIDGQGVWEIDKSDLTVSNVYKEDSDNPNSLKGNGVYDIYSDNNNRVWICSYSGGVSFFDKANPAITQLKHIVNNSNSLINNDVNDVLEDSNGNLWFATNNGVSFLNVKSSRWKSLFQNKKEQAQVFLTLSEDSQGRIWAGTYSSGVYLIDAKNGVELKHLSVETTDGQFRSNFVFDIIKDSQGNMWCGGVNGDLICYNTKQDSFRSFDNMTIYNILDYKSDKLLLGSTYGLILFDKNTGETETLLEGYIVQDIFVNQEIILICTSGNGLILYNSETREIESFTVDSGLPSNFISSIQHSNGFFWLGTEQGLCRLNPEDKSILTFNSLLTLNNASFNLAAHDVMADGRLVFGSSKGALIFDPGVIQPVENQGRIYFQDLTISGRSIRELNTPSLTSPLDSLANLALNYYQNTISLEMIPIGVAEAGAKFSWKLEDLDQEWSRPSSNKILSYSNIPSGSYTLRIRMLDNSNSNVLAERIISLEMIPPYWETLWFQIIVFVFILGVFVFSMLYYIDLLKKKHSDEKIRFFANTAHDIRTSLTLINGPVEELNKESGLSDKGLHYLHLATDQTRRLLKVATQLMDFQKSDIGKERISLSMVDVVKIIENRVMMFESYASNKSIQLYFSSNIEKFETAIDETLMDKVVDNLISNAIKYSPADTSVQVNLKCSSTKWILEVKDQGIGISKQAQRQLFKEYYRAENVINSKIVGSGIGLLLVKNYVNLHGGKINCTSQLNLGASFEVTIPTREVEVSELKKDMSNSNTHQPVIIKQEFSPSILSDGDDSGKPKMKVLIVEDNEYLREFLKSALESQFKIFLAEDGVQAWNLIQQQTPDMVVSDIMMPNMDGFELCRKIKSTYETSHLPVILLTALAGKAEQLQGLGLGADDYLTKPFDVSILQQRIRTLVQNREIIRDRALKIIQKGEGDTSILENELNDKFLKRMIEVVHENISNAQFSKNDFASAMNASPSLLYKKIKSLTDQSPTDFIKLVRLNHSLELLSSKKYNITEVSELCGFSSVGYFSTVFRKHYGKSPSQMIES